MSDEPMYCVQCGNEWGDPTCHCPYPYEYEGEATYCHFCGIEMAAPQIAWVCEECDKRYRVDRPGRDERGEEASR